MYIIWDNFKLWPALVGVVTMHVHGLFKICLDILNRDRKPAKSDYQLVITVHSTVGIEQLGFIARIYMKFDIWVFFGKLSRIFKFDW